ncbi:MAG: MazG nucleotide pyrophosphohydrolase domain-containing protein [bacterium]
MTSFEELWNTIKQLRSENGCPWDRRQTLETMAPYLCEEVNEALEELKKNSMEGFSEELGDVFLILLMLIRIAEQAGHFTLEEVLRAAAEKIIRRHPHVFSGLEVESEDEIIRNWAQIKEMEKKEKIKKKTI